MQTRDDGGTAMRALAVAALALIGLAFSLTPIAAHLDNSLIDTAWRILRRFDRLPAPDDIVIVGIDEASVAAIAEPPGLWHASLARALARLGDARPRAVLFDFPLPDRSYDSVKPGVDRMLLEGLAAALESSPFVAALNIDPRTRTARNIHRPYLALLGEARLGLGLVARDADGVARRFSLLVPTEDGGFPTVVGRLCRQLKVECTDGMIHYSLGKPFSYVPLKSLLQISDDALVRRLFRDRIVLVGETQAYTGRIETPVNPAGWEQQTRDTPAIVLQAQTLRTALARAAPRETSRAVGVLLVSLAALIVLVRDARMASITALVAAAVAAILGVAALRSGTLLPLAAVLATLALGVTARWALRLRRTVHIP
jgi:CHASE2 domain-containing sensor protein